MSNRVFWMCSVLLSLGVAGLVLVAAGPATAPVSCHETVATACDAAPKAIEVAPAESDPLTDALSEQIFAKLNAERDPEDPPTVPGRPLAWYIEHYDKSIRPQAALQACFDVGTPPEVVEFVEQNVYESNLRFNLTNRWSGAAGTPRALTWSFVPDGVSIPGGGAGEPTSNNVLFATMDAQFAAAGGRATWVARIQSCFDRWQALTGLSYTRVTVGGNDWDDGAALFGSAGAAGLRGDCRISMHSIDGASNVLAYNFFPSTGDMVLDADDDWTLNPNRAHLRLRNVVSHEHGHGIGLLHVCPANQTKLMEPFISSAYDTQRHDDIRAAQRHYGDVSGSNNTAGTARVLGLCEVGSPINLGTVPNPLSTLGPPGNSSTLSIDADGEVDYYKFTVAGSRAVTVTVTPRGLQYASYAQDSACNNTTINVDSLNMANLSVDLIDTNGVTVLSTAAAQPVGVAETISGFVLPVAGDYYVRVYEANAPTEPQLYLLDISVQTACTPPIVNPIAPASTACGSAFSSATPSASGTAPLTWSLGGSPPVGVTINPLTGQVSWPNPIASLTPYAIQVTATNACGSDSKILTLTVLPGDFDGNGILDDLDITPLVDHVLGNINTQPCAADVNNDGFIDGLDIVAWVGLAV